MAIHPELRPQGFSQGPLTPQQTRAISAWTEQATASLRGLSVSETTRDEPIVVDSTARPGLRGASVSLAIPLDDDLPPTGARSTSRVKISDHPEAQQSQSVSFRRREPIRRDSLKRREALLKGKDGSRRRQRWENGMPIGTDLVGPMRTNGRSLTEQPLGGTSIS